LLPVASEPAPTTRLAVATPPRAEAPAARFTVASVVVPAVKTTVPGGAVWPVAVAAGPTDAVNTVEAFEVSVEGLALSVVAVATVCVPPVIVTATVADEPVKLTDAFVPAGGV